MAYFILCFSLIGAVISWRSLRALPMAISAATWWLGVGLGVRHLPIATQHPILFTAAMLIGIVGGACMTTAVFLLLQNKKHINQ